MKKNICIVGLGYVGLPLAHAFAENKFKVIGLDINNKRIEELKSNYDRTLEINESQLIDIKNSITYTTNINDAIDSSIFIVTVPTPIDASNRPDLTPLIKSSELVGSILKKGDIVIYESTVYPGVTEDVCVPELEKKSNLKSKLSDIELKKANKKLQQYIQQ